MMELGPEGPDLAGDQIFRDRPNSGTQKLNSFAPPFKGYILVKKEFKHLQRFDIYSFLQWCKIYGKVVSMYF